MRSPPASTSRLLRVVAGFQVSISGRFWVSTEEVSTHGLAVARGRLVEDRTAGDLALSAVRTVA
jgi:hypothetical protein